MFIKTLAEKATHKDFDSKRHQELIDQANEAVANTDVDPRWHPQVHVAPKAGWMNDPNGVCYFGGRYHMFFQHYPYGSNWGPMHWGHASSKDLVTWERFSITLAPSEEYDEDGVWSGTSLVLSEDELAIFYTGNRWVNGEDDSDGKIQTQCLAVTTDGVNFTKLGSILDAPEGVEDIRDPKVWREADRWWMIIGVSAPVEGGPNRGQVWLYSSDNLIDWDFEQVLYEDPDSLCYMVECPDFFELNGKHVLVYCPMTTAPRRGYGQRNGHNNGYAAGDWEPGGEFVVKHEFSQFDWGHHYYAPQSLKGPDGRQIIFGWMGGFELPLASQKDDAWSGHLATPRVLGIDDEYVLRANPIAEVEQLREVDKAVVLNDFVLGVDETRELMEDAGPVDIELEVDLSQTTSEQVSLLLNRVSETEYTEVAYDSLSNRVVLDRGKMQTADRGYRAAPYTGGDVLKLRVIVDRGSVEVIVNDGEHALSSLVFPREGKRSIALASNSGTIAVNSLAIYPLKSIWA